MARTKHRKGHKEASARRSAYNRLMHRIETAGQPVEVGKNRFKVLPDFEEDVTITMDGQTVPALITNDGTIRLESGPDKGTLLHVDYRPIEERVMAQMLGPENFVIQARGAGKTRELKNFIAQAEAAGRAVLRADVLKQELRELHGLDPQQDGETVYVSVPKRQLQDVVDTTQRFYSMGCDFGAPGGDSTVVLESVPLHGRRAGMSEHLGKQEMGRMLRNYHMEKDAALTKEDATLRPVTELPAGFRPGVKTDVRGPARLLDYVSEMRPYPEELKRLESYPLPLAPPMLMSERTADAIFGQQAHLEPVFERDADGKPCGIKEISVCPGPDPNGLTTLQFPTPDMNADITNAMKNPEFGL